MYSCGGGKTEIHRIRVEGGKRRFSNTMTPCLGSRLTLPHIRFKNGVWTQIFFQIRGKKSPFWKVPAVTCGSTRPEPPSTRSRIFSKTEMFFSEYGYTAMTLVPSTRSRRFRPPQTKVFKYTLQAGWRLVKTETYRIRVDGRKRTFLNTMTSCLGSRFSKIRSKKSKIPGYVWTVKYDSN